MTKEILVAMKPQDRIDHITACLEEIMRPGMKVTFLFRYPVEGFVRPKEVFGKVAGLEETKRLTVYYSWEENQKRAEEKVAFAAAGLRSKGADVAVDLYAGSLKREIANRTTNGNICTVMKPAGIGHWIANFFTGSDSVFGSFRRPNFFSVLLIRPRISE